MKTVSCIVEMVAIDRVIPYARNPRRNEAAVAKVASSIREFGWRQPIVVDREYVVIAGHTRLLAARQLGLAEVPVHVATELTSAQAKAYRLADNRVAQEASWDAGLLDLELGDLRDVGADLSSTGFGDRELDRLLAREVESPTVAGDATDQWLCVVTCQHERQLAALYEELTARGLECKLVT